MLLTGDDACAPASGWMRAKWKLRLAVTIRRASGTAQ